MNLNVSKAFEFPPKNYPLEKTELSSFSALISHAMEHSQLLHFDSKGLLGGGEYSSLETGNDVYRGHPAESHVLT